MNVLLEVSTIAVGTAVLAALIVAADWDLAVIRVWQTLTTSGADAGARAVGSPSLHRPAVTGMRSLGACPASGELEATEADLAEVSNTDRARADEWLAAAAAHRLPEFAQAQACRDNEESSSVPPIPLRHALNARWGDRPVDAEVA